MSNALISLNGKPLWGLVRPKSKAAKERLDFDYIPALLQALNSSNQVSSRAAASALIFLNAYALAETGNPEHLAAVTPLAPTQKLAFYDSWNAARRDLFNQAVIDQITDFITPAGVLADLVDTVKAHKALLRSQGISIADDEARRKRAETGNRRRPLPVKNFTKEEREALARSRA
jgi:hypothetical protein